MTNPNLTSAQNAAEELTQERLRLASMTRAPYTIYCYSSQWKLFCSWCLHWNRTSLPASPETVGLYITELLKTHKISTAEAYAAAINYFHRIEGHAIPADSSVRLLLAGARRLKAEAIDQKAAVTVEQIKQMVEKEPEKQKELRDRAVLLLGFATALRRANLCALELADLEFTDRGLVVRVRREKQDQLGRGRVIGVPFGHGETCPVAAVKQWLHRRGSSPGPLFPGRDGKMLNRATIANVVKRAAKRLGLDPRRYGGHSMRAGFVTEAFERGCDAIVVAETTGHRSMDVLRRYFRRTDPFRACAFASFGM